MDAALLTGDEHAAWLRHVVSAIALVDIGALDAAAGQRLGLLDHPGEGVSAEPGAQEPQLAIGPLELLGMGVAPRHQRRPLGHPPIGLAQRDDG